MTEPAVALLIDDETAMAGPLTDAFADNGMSLDIASSWSTGMELFQVVGHDLVIADYDLQEAQTGLRLLAEVRKMAPSTRLILISGRLTDEAQILVDESGAADMFLLKTDRNLRQILLREGREAMKRSGASDWSVVGADYPRAAEVDMERVRKLEDRLRLQLRADRR